MQRTLNIILLLCFMKTFSAAQVTVSDFHAIGEKSIPLKQYIDSLFNQKQHRVYYLDEWVKNIHIPPNLSSSNQDSVLVNVLNSNRIQYITDNSGNIILTGKIPVQSELPGSFFKIEKSETNVILENGERHQTNGEVQVAKGITQENVTIGSPGSRVFRKKATFSGHIKDLNTGEPVIGAVLYSESEEVGTVTDNDGYFVMSLAPGQHIISLRCVGMQNKSIRLQLFESGSCNFNMKEEITALRGVIVIADKGKNISGMQVGMNKVSVELMKQIPSVMGETDVLKTAILLPGVQTVGEGSAGFNVRGGSTDQNLILLNSAPVFNSSHFFGFFSAFNPDLVKEFKLYKSGIPAEYGGRVSSVFDITTKTGNNRKLSGAGGISPVTGRFMVEGPTIKESGSFILGVRSTFSDYLLKQFKVSTLQRSNASFYDANIFVTQNLNANNDISMSLYMSNDQFQLGSDTSYRYHNRNGSFAWKHLFSDKIINENKFIYSHYDYKISSNQNILNASELKYAIDYYELRSDFRYYFSNIHRIKFGINSKWYMLNPGIMSPGTEQSLVKELSLEREKANELSVYFNDEITLSDALSVSLGMRLSLYRYLGPKIINYYYDGPREPFNLAEQTIESGTIKSYLSPEPRIAMRYKTNPTSSMKLSYNRMRQNLHMLSNTTAISPTDIWKLSDPHIKPQSGDQIAVGYYRDFRSNTIETSVEVYYKYLDNIIEYKGGASLIMNEMIETDLINGKGHAYGMELLIRKKYGRLNGLLSYTYSRTLMKVQGIYSEETINHGQYYPANYDKPHDATAVVTYRFNRRISVSTNITYSTGRPITYPVAKYQYRQSEYVHYSFRNEYRVPDYFRTDVSFNLEGNLKKQKLAHSSWALSVYNLTGRNNVYSIFFVNRSGQIQGYKLSIFSEPIPTLTYSFRF